MALTLAIENETQLPDGGPVSIRVIGRRGIDIGRDQHLDWTLPDPERVISGTHCEIRYRDGGYWLTDVSRNGTFVNGSDRRLHEPHRLRDGDRLEIGKYLVAVGVDKEDAEPPAETVAPRPPAPDEIWGDVGEAPPPISEVDLRRPPDRLLRSDFLDWAVDIPDVHARASAPRGPAPAHADPVRDALGPDPLRAGRSGEAFADRWDGPESAWRGTADDAAMPSRPPPAIGSGEDSAAPERDRPASLTDLSSEWGRPEAVRQESARPANPAPGPDVGHAPQPGSASDREFLRRLARGAGVPEAIFAEADAGEIAEEVGTLLRIVSENLKQMLSARAESRAIVRSSRQTMIQALDNNPLKFSPTAEDALRIMFGPPSKGYLDPARALTQSFEDLKAHQILTFSAMQQAVRRLSEEIEPGAMERALNAEKKGGVLASRRARLWDRYVAWWKSTEAAHDNGLLDAFMLYFSESYQRSIRKED